MRSIRVDANISDAARREALYQGDLFVYSPTPATLALTELARSLLQEAFDPLDPETAQYEMTPHEYAQILAALKPRFIHHPECKVLIPRILTEHGCDPEETYFDVPRLRTSTSDAFLTTGIAYAFHPHRDTWYSAAHCQINWWLPVYEMDTQMGMAFHPRYFEEPIENNSEVYDYYRWNAQSRANAATHVGTDTREQPKPQIGVDHSGDFEIVTPVGGLTLFSAAQLHSSIPNNRGRTRVSIDFRTVSASDAAQRRGAPNVDSRCTGTSLRDFLRASDLHALQEDICTAYDSVPPGQDATLVYRPAPN